MAGFHFDKNAMAKVINQGLAGQVNEVQSVLDVVHRDASGKKCNVG